MNKILVGTHLLLVLLGPTIGLTASAAGYPDTEKVTMYVSSGTVSTWTETTAEDYLVPESQVFIAGRGLGASNYLGLLGVLIDRSHNASSTSVVEAALRQNFAQMLSGILKSRNAASSQADRYVQVQLQDTAQLTLIPSAKLSVADDGLAMLSFRLTVRADGDKKEFFYIVSERRPVLGPNSWSDQSSKVLVDVASVALTRLTDVLFDDMTGAFASSIASGQKTFVAFRSNDKKFPYYGSQVLKEYPDYVVTTSCGSRQMVKFFTVIDRSGLVAEQDGSKLPMKCGNV
jgi:hypothetical protein